MRADGRDVTTVATNIGSSAAITWASDTSLIFEQIGRDDGMQRVNAAGGRVELLIPLDTAVGEVRQRRPLVLRAAGVVVYGSYQSRGAEPTLVMYRMADRRRVRLELEGIGALGMINDRLVYSLSDGTLMAVEVDVRAMQTRGEPVRLGTRVAASGTGTSVALSASGALVHAGGEAGALSRLDLIDTLRKASPLHAAAPIVGLPRFSRDGRRVAVGIGVEGRIGRANRVTTSDLWTIDVGSGEATRLTSNGDAANATWFPDGRRIAYLKVVAEGFEIWSARADVFRSRATLARIRWCVPSSRACDPSIRASRPMDGG